MAQETATRYPEQNEVSNFMLIITKLLTSEVPVYAATILVSSESLSRFFWASLNIYMHTLYVASRYSIKTATCRLLSMGGGDNYMCTRDQYYSLYSFV